MPVAFGDVAANGAFPAGVARIDRNTQHGRKASLVLDKASQLVERPTGHQTTLPLAKPGPVTDALEVLQGNAASRCLQPW